MQPREIQAMNSLLNQTQMSLQELQNHHHHHQHMDPSQINHHFDPATPPAHDDFLDQMLSSVPSSSPWPDIPKSPWDLSSNTSSMLAAAIGLNKSRGGSDDNDGVSMHRTHFDHDQSALLAAKLQIGGGATSAVKNLLMQQQMMLQSRGFGGGGGGGLPSPNGGSGDSGLMPMPLSLSGAGSDDIDVSSFKSPSPGDGSVQALFNGFSGSLHQTPNPQFQHPQGQSYGGSATNQAPAASGSTGGASAQPRQRVRARRGQATDPHSIAERLRRERIAERMKALQELVPNANKTDKASMLDEIIDYVKFLQLQVKVLSMSRLGGASAVAPLVADMSSEGGRGGGRGGNGNQTASTTAANDTMTVTEHQVAKLMEEDMGTAMQYLQGKGLCLMPISLANAISTATCRNPMASAATTVNPLLGGENGGGPTSPTLSALTVQSATMGNGGRENPGKDSADP